ncbi:MAG: hypothetical protein IKQ70_01315 [Bacteroidales bacterium]|nr:hypothetical protein [Bacteroidales bacterium]MBR6176505.1 hypothetical protein [Bacteroidales bacterium]
MENIGSGFCKGFGGMFGVIAAILLIALLIWLVMYIHDCMIIRKEMPKMLLMARKVLKENEQYEELSIINKYAKQLKKNILPQEIRKRFSVEIRRYVQEDYGDKGSRMYIAQDKILKYNPPAKKAKAPKDKPNNQNTDDIS